MEVQEFSDIIRLRLSQAGRANICTRTIVTEVWTIPVTIPHTEILDLNLKLNLLHEAAWTGDAETIQELKLQNWGNPAERTAGGYTALHLAASRDHTNAVKELLDWLGDDARGVISEEGFTPLHLAAYGKSPGSVKLLLGVSDVNARDSVFGRTALHFAAQRGQEEIVRMLMATPGVDFRCKDKVRDMTPFLLAAMQPKSRLGLVKTLLDADVTQISDKVGNLPYHMVENVVTQSRNEIWQQITSIQIDNSMKSKPDLSEENESDLYGRYSVIVTGHNALHSAATQDNAELVSYLVSLDKEGILLDEGDKTYGMTPLHCAVITGAMNAFRALMMVQKLNVSAKLAREGFIPFRSWWLPPISEFISVHDKDLMFFQNFQRYDTPLHLAIRVSPAKDLSEMVIDFCNHPKFNPTIHNAEMTLSLELAWLRLGFCAQLPSLFEVRKEVSQEQGRKLLENYQYGDRVYINRAINLLERHPLNGSIMSELAGRKKSAHDSVNAFLVTATLLAGVTFSAYLQPPFGGDVGKFMAKPVKLFWTFNGLSFFFAVYTILRCLVSTMSTDRREDFAIFNLGLVAMIRIQSAVPLTVSVGFGIGAFVAAGFANIPPDANLARGTVGSKKFDENVKLMLSITISGLLLVLFQLLRNFYIAFSTLNCSMLDDQDDLQDLKRSHYIKSLMVLCGGSVKFLTDYVKIHGFRSRGKIRVVRDEGWDYLMNLGFVAIQLYAAIAVALYVVIVIVT